jgi:hypothetical protein
MLELRERVDPQENQDHQLVVGRTAVNFKVEVYLLDGILVEKFADDYDHAMRIITLSLDRGHFLYSQNSRSVFVPTTAISRMEIVGYE